MMKTSLLGGRNGRTYVTIKTGIKSMGLDKILLNTFHDMIFILVIQYQVNLVYLYHFCKVVSIFVTLYHLSSFYPKRSPFSEDSLLQKKEYRIHFPNG